MNLFQFLVFSIFIITCIVTTYMNSKRMLRLRKQRDSLGLALQNLITIVSQPYFGKDYNADKNKAINAARRAIGTFINFENSRK